MKVYQREINDSPEQFCLLKLVFRKIYESQRYVTDVSVPQSAKLLVTSAIAKRHAALCRLHREVQGMVWRGGSRSL